MAEALDPELGEAHAQPTPARGAPGSRTPASGALPGRRRVGQDWYPSARWISGPPISVVGAGYVGLVTAVGLAGLGHDVRLSRPARPSCRSARWAGADPRGRTAGGVHRRDRGWPTDRRRHPARGSRHRPGLRRHADRRRWVERPEPARRGPGEPAGTLRPGRHPGHPQHAAGRRHAPGGRDGRRTRRAGSSPTRSSSARAPPSPTSRAPTRIVIGRFHDADPAALEALLGLYAGLDAPRSWSTSRRPRSSRTEPTRSWP